MMFLILSYQSHLTEVSCMPMTHDWWYFYFILYIFCNICKETNSKNIFLLIPTENKVPFQIIGSRTWKFNSSSWFHCQRKKSENFLTQKIWNENPSNLHHKCTRVNPLVSLWSWEFFVFFFDFLINFELIKLIWGNRTPPPPRAVALQVFKNQDGWQLCQQQLPCYDVMDTGGMLTHESTSMGRRGSLAAKTGPFKSPQKKHAHQKLMPILLPMMPLPKQL